MNVLDRKGREININKKVCIQDDIRDGNNILSENTICEVVDTFSDNSLKVKDRSGKIWLVSGYQVSVGYL